MKKAADLVTWIVVADGERARFLMRKGRVGELASTVLPEMEHDNPATHEQGVERPGRTHESAGGGQTGLRHSMEPRVDWHKFEKVKFAREVAQILDRAAAAHSFDKLMLIAPPETLGNLRAALGDTATRAVSEEIAKDLTHLSLPDLSAYFTVSGRSY